MVRCAADTRSSEHVGKEGDVRFKETLCPLKYLQEVWQKPNRGVKNNLDSSSRQEFAKSGSTTTTTTTSTSNSSRGANYRGKRHNRVSEKYYDCLQCAEQCRHTNVINQSAVNPIKKPNNRNINHSGTNNNNNNKKNNNKNRAQLSSRKKENEEMVTGSESRELVLSTKPTSSSVTSKNFVQMNKNLKKSSSVVGCFGVDEFYKRKKIHSVTKGDNTKKLISKGAPSPGPLTPAKKRSSLARPVKVHDSFVQAKRPMTIIECQSERNNVRLVQRQSNSQDSGTTGCEDALEERTDEDNSWPIRLRFEEMLELTLTRGKRSRRIRTSKRKKMILTSKYGHFKDTERLLKVLSVNNVDQDNRYNVKRCSVM